MANVNIAVGNTVSTTWDVNANGGSSKGVYRYYLYVKLNSQDTIANTSNVTVTLKLSCNFSSSTMWNFSSAPTAKVGYRKGTSGDYTYSNSESFSTFYANTHSNQTTLVTKTWDIENNSDGTLSAQFNFVWTDNTGGFSYAPPSTTKVYPDSSSVVVFPTIPRASTFSTWPSTGTTTSQVSYTISSASTSFTHSIVISYSGVSQTVTNSTTGSTSISSNFTISTSIRNKMRANKVITANLSVVLSTLSSGTVVGTNSYSISVTVPTPTITVYGNGTSSGGSVRCDTSNTKITIGNLDKDAAYYSISRYYINNGTSTLAYSDFPTNTVTSTTKTIENLGNLKFEELNTTTTSCNVLAKVSLLQGTSTSVATVQKDASASYTVTIPVDKYKPVLQFWNGSSTTSNAISPTYLSTSSSYNHSRYGNTTVIPAFLAGYEGATIPFKESYAESSSAAVVSRVVTIINTTTRATININYNTPVSTINNNTIVTVTTDTLPASTTNYDFTIKLTVTDTRGGTASLTSASATATGYTLPTLSYNIARATSDGSAYDGEGTKIRAEISSGTSDTISSLYVYKIALYCTVEDVTYSKSYSGGSSNHSVSFTWAPLSLTSSSSTTLNTFNTSTRYTFLLEVEDSLKFKRTVTLQVPVATVQLSLHRNVGVGLGTSARQGYITNGLPLTLNTPVNITHQGDVQGTTSFDGHTAVTENLWAPYCTVRRSNANNTYVYHRIATIGEIGDNWYDASGILLIDQGYTGGGYGIARIILRTNNVTVDHAAPSASIEWLVRTRSLSANCLRWGLYNNSGKATLDIYYYATGTYSSCVVRKLESYRGYISSNRWTLVNSVATGSGATSTDTVTTEVYTGINRIAYTSTGTATETGLVETANKATKLGSSTLGDSYTPIYLSSGAPTSTNSFLRIGTSTPLASNTTGHNVVNGEIVFKNSRYVDYVDDSDTASGIGCSNKGTRYLVNELLTDGIIAPAKAYSLHNMSTAANTIRFYKYSGTANGQWSTLTKTAEIDTNGLYRPKVSKSHTISLTGISAYANSTTVLRFKVPIPPGYSSATLDSSTVPSAAGAGSTSWTTTGGTIALMTGTTDQNFEVGYLNMTLTMSSATFTASRCCVFQNGNVTLTLS